MAHGGPVSAPCASLDLETAVERFYTSPAVAQEVGWYLDGFAPSELVQGMLHVDDAIAFSKVFCEDCLYEGVRKLWPEDVGVSLEASGEAVPFLHVLVHVHKDASAAPVHVTPLGHNSDFARGLAFDPFFAKLAPHAGKDVTPQAQLAQYASSRLSTADQVFRGKAVGATEFLAELCAETVLLQWPLPVLAGVLRAYPRSNASDFAVLVRRTGARLKREGLQSAWGPRVYELFGVIVGECLASLWMDAGVVP